MSAWAQAILQGAGRAGNETAEAKQANVDAAAQEQQRKLQLLQSQMGLKELQQRLGMAPQELALKQQEGGIRQQEAQRLQDEFELRKKLANQPSFLGFQKVGGRVVYGLQKPDGTIDVKEAPGFDESKEAGALESSIMALPPGVGQQAARAAVAPYIMGGDYTGAMNALKPYLLQYGKSGMPTETISDSEQWIQSGDKWIKVPKRTVTRKGVAAPTTGGGSISAVRGGGSSTSPKPGVTIPVKATSDEMRRADLAENMTENLNQLEDIVKRRPELFGRFAGHYTTLRNIIGTSDPDVATLKAIHDFLGRASQGAHGMRAATGVAAAADAVMSSFLNSPQATEAAIKSARGSISTFTKDINRDDNNDPMNLFGKGGK